MTLDFRGQQLRTRQIIVSGSLVLPSASYHQLLIYPYSSATNASGSVNPGVTASVGTDTFVFVSGSIGSMGGTTPGVFAIGGDTYLSGTLLGANSILATFPGSGTPIGGLTSSLAANLVSYGMQYQTAFSVRNKTDTAWMTAFLCLDHPGAGGGNNYVGVGDVVGGLFAGNPLNPGIIFFASCSNGLGAKPFVRFDPVNGNIVSGSTTFLSGTVVFRSGTVLSGTTTYIGATIASASVQTTNFVASAFQSTYYISASVSVTASLPVNPTLNQRIEFIDISGSAAGLPLLVTSSGSVFINNVTSSTGYVMNRAFGGITAICVASASAAISWVIPQ